MTVMTVWPWHRPPPGIDAARRQLQEVRENAVKPDPSLDAQLAAAQRQRSWVESLLGGVMQRTLVDNSFSEEIVISYTPRSRRVPPPSSH